MVTNTPFETSTLNSTTTPKSPYSTGAVYSSTSFFANTTQSIQPTDFHSTTVPNITNSSSEHGCLWILYEDIGLSKVRIWDVMLFVPNVIFFLFVMYRLRRVWHRVLSGIGSGGSPIFITYFVLVALAALLGVIRGIVSMTVDLTTIFGSDANKVLWVILRFFLLMVELSVLVFGIAFGRLDSKASVKRVLVATTTAALTYSIIQCTLELVVGDKHFDIKTSNRSVYGHGGALFCLVTSVLFLVLYVGVLAIPFIKYIQNYLSVPSRKSFYVYIVFMALLYFTSTIGSTLLLFENSIGLCFLDGYSVAYFSIFAPLIYWAFLSSYFVNTQPSSMLFAYASQVDEGLADVADYDFPGNGITVDSTLSGILVFNHGPDGDRQPTTRDYRASSDLSTTTPSSDSTHSFIRGPR